MADQFAEKNIVQQGNGDEAKRGAYIKDLLRKGAYSGTVYVCAGNAGTLEPGPLNHPVMAVSRKRLGSVFLTINRNEARVIMLGADGEMEDSFTIRKVPIRPLE